MSIYSLLSFFPHGHLYAQSTNNSSYNLDQLVLPSDVEGLGKKTGSIYYTDSEKNKVLIPAHFWGEIRLAGLHFIPTGTSLVKGLSLAGGPTGRAMLDNIRISRKEDNKLFKYNFDLSEGGDVEAHAFTIKPGDTVFIEKSTYSEDRAYYTSLISVAVTILTGILLYRRVEDR